MTSTTNIIYGTIVVMCWNASVSLNTFLLGAFSVGLATFNGVIPVIYAIYYMSYIGMQLIEYFLWSNLKSKDANAFWSKMGLALIFIQPILALLCVGIYNPVAWGMIALYVAFMAYVGTYVIPLHKIDFSSERASNGHLRWNWLQVPMWALAVWVSFVLFDNVYRGHYFDALWKFALAAAVYFTYARTNTWGSLWCWITNAVSLVLLWKVFSSDICGYVKKKLA